VDTLASVISSIMSGGWNNRNDNHDDRYVEMKDMDDSRLIE
jgi:hypothetical protein